MLQPESYLGKKPPAIAISGIVAGKRSPNAPYDLYQPSPLTVPIPPNESPSQPLSVPQLSAIESPSQPLSVPLLSVEPPSQPTVPIRKLSADELFERFQLKDVPAERQLSPSELANVLKLTILDVTGADVFCRDANKNLLNPQQQLQLFNDGRAGWTVDTLKTYAKTRGLNTNVNKPELLASIAECVQREAKLDRFLIVDPTGGTGQYEKARKAKLILLNVLTYQNAPGFVPVPCPNASDPQWRFTRPEDLHGMNFIQILYDWHDLFFLSAADTDAHLRKAMRKVTSGRPYYCRVNRTAEWLWITWLVDRSRVKKNFTCELAFKLSTGREAIKPQLVAAMCKGCTAGENTGACSHVFAAILGLNLLQCGHIQAGDVGDGEKTWSQPKSSSESVQSLNVISRLLKGGSKLADFTGYRTPYTAGPRIV
jgi:hypothetical protein